MALATNLGFPRIGPNRELKAALEKYWKGELSQDDLQKVAKFSRQNSWKRHQALGFDQVPTGDFSFYDQMLDMACLLGAIPDDYKWSGGKVDLDTYFAMARGRQTAEIDVPALEMTKWYDTNYHYMVPRLKADQKFQLTGDKPMAEFLEAKAAGLNGRPVIIGPVSFLMLSKRDDGGDTLELLDNLLPVYGELLKQLADAGAEWVQIDEACLVMDLEDEQRKAFMKAYDVLAAAVPNVKLLLTTYFDDLRDNLSTALSLPVAGVHLDLVRAPEQLDAALAQIDEEKVLSVGVVNGRNIWRANLDNALELVKKAVADLGSERVFIAPSCSMLHSPYDLSAETELDNEVKSWLAFAQQKLEEIAVLTKAINEGEESVASQLQESRAAISKRSESTRIHSADVKSRLQSITSDMAERGSIFAKRREKQIEALGLPLYPTTTIGSFPQTKDVRKARSEYKKGLRDAESYDAFLKQQTEECVRFQEEIGIDVLVHGEFERNDMVEYFGEQLDGFVFTKNGWVQSYGSRCVKPPIIFGDVSRPQPMTVEWSVFAQSLTKQYMKGMLTGPVTILQWSFVRDDQPRADTCRQIALAIRDEVSDLEEAGIKIIQIDEPALREGLPLHQSDWQQYLDWAVESFKLASSSVADSTQIHTHMCYSEFNDIMPAIAALDADVISVETSRSKMELLEAFENFNYPNEIGPGVYDIHSPRVPDASEMVQLMQRASKVLSTSQLWVNPDCGLKTRGWDETKSSLKHMVEAAKTLRQNADSAAA